MATPRSELMVRNVTVGVPVEVSTLCFGEGRQNGEGLNLDGWNTIYRVWLGCLYHGRNKESSSNRRGWLISHSGAYFHL